MVIDPYHSRSEVSNSNLSELKRELYHAEWKEPEEIFAFGNLVDYMITEPDRITWTKRLVDGKPLYGIRSEKESNDWDLAIKMKNAFMRDKDCVRLLKRASFQKVSVIRGREFYVNDVRFSLDCRCKWDIFGYDKRFPSGDIKTTAAKTQKQFIAACHYFDYPRSRAWYMDLENTDKDITIGISKSNCKIFFMPITRGDENYQIGKAQYEELAFNWWMLKN